MQDFFIFIPLLMRWIVQRSGDYTLEEGSTSMEGWEIDPLFMGLGAQMGEKKGEA